MLARLRNRRQHERAAKARRGIVATRHEVAVHAAPRFLDVRVLAQHREAEEGLAVVGVELEDAAVALERLLDAPAVLQLRGRAKKALHFGGHGKILASRPCPGGETARRRGLKIP